MRLARTKGWVKRKQQWLSDWLPVETKMSVKTSSAMVEIIRRQAGVGTLFCLALVVFGYTGYGLALLYGVGLMMVNGWWLARRLAKTKGLDVRSGQRSLYAGAAVRFVALIVGLLIAQGLGLHLLAVAAGMFTAQAIVFASAVKEFKDGKGEDIG